MDLIDEPEDVFVTDKYRQHIEESNEFPAITFKYWKRAYMKVYLQNTDCYDENDSIYFHFSPDQLTNYPSVGHHEGCADSEEIFKRVPAGPMTCKWYVTKNGETNSFQENITLGNGDTLTYIISY